VGIEIVGFPNHSHAQFVRLLVVVIAKRVLTRHLISNSDGKLQLSRVKNINLKKNLATKKKYNSKIHTIFNHFSFSVGEARYMVNPFPTPWI
jgi:hypothetical protein